MAGHETTELWLIRHGESEANADGRLQGQSDFPLTARGHQQARSLGESLRRKTFASLYTSDLQRAADTADAIARALGLPAVTEPRLREIDTGDWSGLTAEEARERFPEEWKRWESRDPDLRRGGGESYRDACARVTLCLMELAARHPGERVLVVFHGAVIRAYLAWVMDLPLSRIFHLTVSNASVSRVRPFMSAIPGDQPRSGRILCINDLAHLRDPAMVSGG